MKIKNEMSGFDRRSFLKTVSVAGVGSMVLPFELLAINPPRNSRVVIVTDDEATNGLNINEDIVQIMIDYSIMNFAQIWDVGDAWQAILPGISSSKIVAIKVNCLNWSMPSHPLVAYAIANSLQKMLFSGGFSFPANKIIIFDRTDSDLQYSGYTINTSSSGVRCFGTSHSGIGYSSQTWNVNGQNKKISRVATEMTDYIINLSVMKNHSFSGVTLNLKNHYGTVQYPSSLHGGNCDPYIPALNAIEPIKSKNVINIIDALFGIKSGGPGGNPQFVANKFIISSDIVAGDYQGRKLLQENGCNTTGQATHIDTAVSYGLGTNQPNQMDIVEMLNPSLMMVLVNQPNGGESLIPDDTYIIQWESTDVNNVKIEYSTNGGLDWINIIDSIAAGTGTYNWTVPNTPSENCIIRISCIDNLYVNDKSDGIFTIQSSSTPVIQTFALNTGFHFISSYVVEENMNMLVLLEDILNENLVYVRDSEGNMLRKIGPNWINGIGDWTSTEGYLFKLMASESFSMEGDQVPADTPIPLPAGFRFVSYLPTSSMDAMTAFASIINDDLEYIRDSEGGMLRKIGPIWVNGIGDANPGEGYLVKILNSGTLIYPLKGSKSSINNNSKATHFNFNGGNAADPVYTIYVNGLEIGDEVAAYDGDVLVGAVKISSENKLLNALPVFSTLNDGKGYVLGNPINLKIYNSNSNEISDAKFTFENIHNSYFENVYPAKDGKYSIVNITKSSINDTSKSLSIYPNPVQTKTLISFNLKSEANTHVWISDTLGKKISTLTKAFLPSGNHQYYFVASGLSAGIYLCHFKFDNYYQTQKFVKN